MNHLVKSISCLGFILVFSVLTGFSQTTAMAILENKLPPSDPRIEALSDKYNKIHTIHGYRIQIISSSKKEIAKKAKSKFASMHQDIEAHEIYQQPFFIIKVGDFLTKLEAEKFHREIEEDFPGSFILPDVIEPYKQYTSEKSVD
jgi:hypothetical protein